MDTLLRLYNRHTSNEVQPWTYLFLCLENVVFTLHFLSPVTSNARLMVIEQSSWRETRLLSCVSSLRHSSSRLTRFACRHFHLEDCKPKVLMLLGIALVFQLLDVFTV